MTHIFQQGYNHSNKAAPPDRTAPCEIMGGPIKFKSPQTVRLHTQQQCEQSIILLKDTISEDILFPNHQTAISTKIPSFSKHMNKVRD